MILGGMGPVDPLRSTGGKLFASFFALYSGLAIISIAGLMLAPLFIDMLHKFHLEGRAGGADPKKPSEAKRLFDVIRTAVIVRLAGCAIGFLKCGVQRSQLQDSIVALVAMPALVASDEWEQVPSDPGQGAASEGAREVKAPAEDKGAMACTLWGRSSNKQQSCATRE